MDDEQLTQSSALVTALAWVFIVLAGFGTLVCILQSLMIAVVFPHGLMQQMASEPDTHVRDFARAIFNHVQLIFLVLLLVFTTTLAAAVGMLKRANWARILFVGLMGLGIVWNVAGVVLMLYFLPSISDILATHSPAFAVQFNVVRDIGFMFDIALAAGLVGLFTWIMKRLMSEEVRREFSVAP